MLFMLPSLVRSLLAVLLAVLNALVPAPSRPAASGVLSAPALRWTQDYQALAAAQPDPLFAADAFSRSGGAGSDTHFYEAFVGPSGAMLRVYTEPYGEAIRHISVSAPAQPVQPVQHEPDPLSLSSVSLSVPEGMPTPGPTPVPAPTPQPTPVPTRAEAAAAFLALASLCVQASMPWLSGDELAAYEDAMRAAFAGDGGQAVLLDGGVQCIAGISTWAVESLCLLIVPAPDMTYAPRPSFYAWQTEICRATAQCSGWNHPVHSATQTGAGHRLIHILPGGSPFIVSYVEPVEPFYLNGFEVSTRRPGPPEAMRAAAEADLALFVDLASVAMQSDADAMLDILAQALQSCLAQIDSGAFDTFSLSLEPGGGRPRLSIDAKMSTLRDVEPYLEITLAFWYP